MTALVEYNEKKIFEVKLKEIKEVLTSQVTEEINIDEVIETVKQQVKDAKLPEIEVVRVIWDGIMDAVQWSGKNQQQNSNSVLRQVSFFVVFFCVSRVVVGRLFLVLKLCYYLCGGGKGEDMGTASEHVLQQRENGDGADVQSTDAML